MARRLVCVLALLACNQSLFDSNPGGKDGGGGGGDDGGGGGDEDGSPPVGSCPEPCAGDAVADFSEAQGGSNGAWFYLADQGAANGADYTELAFGSWGDLAAWSAGPDGPAIASCAGVSDAACAGLDGFVLLVPGSGAERPALAFRAPETATYRLSGAVRIADGAAADVQMQVLTSRAGRHDAIAVREIRTSESETGLDGVVPAIQGDEIMLSIAGVVDSNIPPLGVKLFFTRVDSGADAFPGSCQVALRFDQGSAFNEPCSDTAVMDLNDGIGPPGTSTIGPGPSGRLGEARVLVEGQYIRVGNSPMNYSGDFTVQFWAKFDEPQPSFDTVPWADVSDIASSSHGGQVVNRDDATEGLITVCYYTRDLENWLCLDGEMATDAAWHFWRLVRSTADGEYRVCIDGAEIASMPVPSDADMTSDEPPYLGRIINFSPAYFGGSLDEVRVFKEALPCVTAP